MRAAANAGGPGGGSGGHGAGSGGPGGASGGHRGGSGAGSAASAAVLMGLPVSGLDRAPPPSNHDARKLVVIDALNVGRSYNVGFTCPVRSFRDRAGGRARGKGDGEGEGKGEGQG